MTTVRVGVGLLLVFFGLAAPRLLVLLGLLAIGANRGLRRAKCTRSPVSHNKQHDMASGMDHMNRAQTETLEKEREREKGHVV